MTKWICSICGYVFEGENPPAACPQCKAPASKFTKAAEGSITWACEHAVGIAKEVDDKEIIDGLKIGRAHV